MTPFTFTPRQLSAFSVCMDTFIISLKNGEIVHHTPDDPSAFLRWLEEHNVRNISADSSLRNSVAGKAKQLQAEPAGKER